MQSEIVRKEYLKRIFGKDVVAIFRNGIRKIVSWIKYSEPTGRAYSRISYLIVTFPARIFVDPKLLAPIVVFQMGKVGSMSVVRSLRRAFRRLSWPVPIFHVHNLNNLDDIEAVVRTRPNPANTLLAMKDDRELRRKIDADPNVNWRVISLVREPIGRNIAWFFQNLDELIPDWQERLKTDVYSLDYLQERFLDTRQGNHDTAETWFENQMYPVFGIDVFAEPFQKEIGYKVYHYGSRVSLLLLRVENLTECGPTVIRDFLGLDEFQLVKINTAADKNYAELYRAFKKKPLPREYVEKIYSTKFARHFYSEQEIDSFITEYTADNEA